jgi:hypothetical protein
MDLVAGEQGIRVHRRANDVPVLGDVGRIVVRARSGIEAGIEPGGNAAFASEKAMTDALQSGKSGGRFEGGLGCAGHPSKA